MSWFVVCLSGFFSVSLIVLVVLLVWILNKLCRFDAISLLSWSFTVWWAACIFKIITVNSDGWHHSNICDKLIYYYGNSHIPTGTFFHEASIWSNTGTLSNFVNTVKCTLQRFDTSPILKVLWYLSSILLKEPMQIKKLDSCFSWEF